MSLLCGISSKYITLSILNFTEHKCAKPGCAEAIILDGNMKNHRAVCSATHAGYIEYKGLPGRVRSGCQNSPAFDSSFCVVHKPVLAVPQRIHIEGEDNIVDVTKTEEEPVGIIMNKRTTRSSTLYQVHNLTHPK